MTCMIAQCSKTTDMALKEENLTKPKVTAINDKKDSCPHQSSPYIASDCVRDIFSSQQALLRWSTLLHDIMVYPRLVLQTTRCDQVSNGCTVQGTPENMFVLRVKWKRFTCQLRSRKSIRIILVIHNQRSRKKITTWNKGGVGECSVDH